MPAVATAAILAGGSLLKKAAGGALAKRFGEAAATTAGGMAAKKIASKLTGGGDEGEGEAADPLTAAGELAQAEVAKTERRQKLGRVAGLALGGLPGLIGTGLAQGKSGPPRYGSLEIA